MTKMLMIYPDRCTGCHNCALSCSFYHDGEFRPHTSRIKVFSWEVEGFSMSRCPLCSGETEESLFSETVESGGLGIIVKNIPGERCMSCGKNCISRSTAEQLTSMIDAEIKKVKDGKPISRFLVFFEK